MGAIPAYWLLYSEGVLLEMELSAPLVQQGSAQLCLKEDLGLPFILISISVWVLSKGLGVSLFSGTPNGIRFSSCLQPVPKLTNLPHVIPFLFVFPPSLLILSR